MFCFQLENEKIHKDWPELIKNGKETKKLLGISQKMMTMILFIENLTRLFIGNSILPIFMDYNIP